MSYWTDRQAQLNEALETDEEALKKRLADIYRKEERKLEKEIAAYYSMYGTDNVVEYRTLLQNLSEADYKLLMERMDDFAEKYPEYAHLMPVRESIYKLNRLEGLEQSVQMQQLELGIKEQEEVEKHLARQAERNFSAMYEDLGLPFNQENKKIIQTVVNTRWSQGMNFSARIWKNRQHLSDMLNDRIASGFARGDNYSKMVTEVKQRFDVSRNEAYRLVYTEGTFVMNESRARACEEVFEYYSLSTAGDSLVCENCQTVQDETEAEPVRFIDRIAGDNFAPIHPWCRCGYLIVVPDEQKWIDDYVAAHGGDPELDEETRKEAQKVLDKFTE